MAKALYGVVTPRGLQLSTNDLQEARDFLKTPKGHNGEIIYSKEARELYTKEHDNECNN